MPWLFFDADFHHYSFDNSFKMRKNESGGSRVGSGGFLPGTSSFEEKPSDGIVSDKYAVSS
ncbi:hypothetical protein EON65_40775 [archaeon]|nr:MAG: hypothetical protein EON65_40775 [archaeon]